LISYPTGESVRAQRLNGPLTLLVPAVVLAITAVAFLLVGGGRALASHVGCGDTITADTTLDSDLEDCPNHGVVIGAAGITLDLNGHRIDGDGTPAAGCDPQVELCDVGVLNEGFNGVAVEHGSVRQFAFGGFTFGVRRNRVLDIGSTRHVFFGWVVVESTRSVIRGGAFRRNIAPEGDGLGLFGCDHVRVRNNAIRRNPGPGIHMQDSDHNLVKGNVFSRNSPAIVMGGDEPRPALAKSDRNRIRRNQITRGGGIGVAPGNRNVVANNRVSRALDSIAIEKGRGNRVTRNRVARSRGPGIRLAIPRPPIGGVKTVVRRNRVRASGEDGFVVFKKDRHSLLSRNVALRSGDDGFDIASDTAQLARNRAVRNADLGIDAAPGVIDGGGNVARENGDPLQCTNILCS
jgi:parallel beta-helix repeat protein